LEASPLRVPMNLNGQAPESVDGTSKLLEPQRLDESERPSHPAQDRAIVRQRKRKGHRLSMLLDDKEEVRNDEGAELIRKRVEFLFSPRELTITLERRSEEDLFQRFFFFFVFVKIHGANLESPLGLDTAGN